MMNISHIIDNLIGGNRARVIVDRIFPYIKNSKSIIDIGCGTGHISALLVEKNKKVTAVDIKNNSFVPSVKVVVYDGKSLPFKNKLFDTSLLITVLHHTPSPQVIFSEAARVGKNIVVMETVYKSFIGKIIIGIFDSILNRQLKPHWNSYKSDTQWRHFFRHYGFEVVSAQYYKDNIFGLPYHHYLYSLKKYLK